MDQGADHKPAPDDAPIPTLGQSVVVRWLLGLNLIVYALDRIVRLAVTSSGDDVGPFTWYGNFNILQGINGFQFWRLVTYQFLHANPLHLGMNLMALYIFGPIVEKWWGPRRFLAFYLLCGACGAWLMALFAFNPEFVNAGEAWLVGASGSIFGVLVAAAMLYPKDEIKLLIPPMWVTTRKLALVFIALSVVAMLLDFNFGGNAAHLGGAFFGFVLVRRPWALDFADRGAPRLEPPASGSLKAWRKRRREGRDNS